MYAIEASFSGTFRTIIILVVIWMVLRWFMRKHGSGHAMDTGSSAPDRRRGDVRIENVPPSRPSAPRSGGTIIDADFEEIK
ncbi:MAG: hypothetical protein IPN62_07450 [Flavobacteriales bacterium]|jgi:hypothetical protein|nr:hypothetical protein [Flavobacteriales bacterium]